MPIGWLQELGVLTVNEGYHVLDSRKANVQSAHHLTAQCRLITLQKTPSRSSETSSIQAFVTWLAVKEITASLIGGLYSSQSNNPICKAGKAFTSSKGS
jgi:hypothetical protein